jgi:hypothetical protein
MKTITAQDSSLLALLAEKPNARSGVRRKVMRKLSPEALNIATEMNRRGLVSSECDGTEAAVTAEGLRRWAETNKGNGKKRGRKAK